MHFNVSAAFWSEIISYLHHRSKIFNLQLNVDCVSWSGCKYYVVTLEVSVLVRSVEAWQPCTDMFLIEIQPSWQIYHHGSTATHTYTLTRRLNEVFMNLVKSYPVHAFHSELSSQQLCHSWQTTRLEGHECPVHSQHFPIKDLRGINVAWPFADIIWVSGYIKIEISCRATECTESWNRSRMMIQIKVVHVFRIIQCNP